MMMVSEENEATGLTLPHLASFLFNIHFSSRLSVQYNLFSFHVLGSFKRFQDR